MESSYNHYLERLINELIKGHYLSSEAVITALRKVHRHRFVKKFYNFSDFNLRNLYKNSRFDYYTLPFIKPNYIDPEKPSDRVLCKVYRDQALIISLKPYTSISAPSVVGKMLESLLVNRDCRVLEIGSGSGWSAGVVAELCKNPSEIFTIEIQPDLAREAHDNLKHFGFKEVNVIEADGKNGLKKAAPFDRIIVTASSKKVETAWNNQLSKNGILVLPLQIHGLGQPIVALRKEGSCLRGRFVRGAIFMPLNVGKESEIYEVQENFNSLKSDRLLSCSDQLAFLEAKEYRDSDKKFGFALFSMLSDSNFQVWVESGRFFLFSSKREGCVVQNQKVSLFGSNTQLNFLMDLFDKWLQAGSPRIQSFEILFGSKRDLPENVYLCWERKIDNLNQIIYLRKI